MIKYISIIVLFYIIIACESRNSAESTEKSNIAGIINNDSNLISEKVIVAEKNWREKYDSTNIDSMIEQFTVKKFIVIVDTNYNYFILRQKMFDLSEKLDIKIDTIERGYDKAKDIIMSEGADEIYTKGYFPRRFNGISLSLEYYEYFLKWMNFEQKNIALVAGIFTEKKEADSLLFQIKKIEPKSFMLKTELYIGCMH